MNVKFEFWNDWKDIFEYKEIDIYIITCYVALDFCGSLYSLRCGILGMGFDLDIYRKD